MPPLDLELGTLMGTALFLMVERSEVMIGGLRILLGAISGAWYGTRKLHILLLI